MDVKGNFVLNGPYDCQIFVVDGDLKVDGIICLSAWDMYSGLIVTGDLIAKALFVGSDMSIHVEGKMILNGPLVCDLSDAAYGTFGEVSALGFFGDSENIEIPGSPSFEVKNTGKIYGAIQKAMGMGNLPFHLK